MTAKILLSATLALLASVSAFGAADANNGETTPIGVSLRLGGFFPLDRAARNEANVWVNGGLDYKLKDLGEFQMKKGNKPLVVGQTAALTLSLDYTGKGDWSSVPVHVNYMLSSANTFYFAGLGVAFTRYPTSSGDTQSKARFSYQLGVGFDLTTGRTPVFAQVKYIGSDQARFAGLAASVGIRF